jgi:hypothetical protein
MMAARAPAACAFNALVLNGQLPAAERKAERKE